MFRIHLARLLTLGTAIFVAGCSSTGGGICSTCNDRPGMFSRFRTTSTTQPYTISSGDCCNATTGPFLPSTAPGTMVPTQPPPNTIPRIDENGKQMPWDGKTSGRAGIKTGNPIQ